MSNSFGLFFILFLLLARVDSSGIKAALPVKITRVAPASLPSFSSPSVVKNLKLPVWPVHVGVIAQLLEWAGLRDASEFIIEKAGGRVVPIQMGSTSTSPFLLLAHHTHSFTAGDPLRALSSLLLPEGFPAHPHAGFSTLTITVDGGLSHRDSEGVAMDYGDGDSQYMKAGRGCIHEEMWTIPPNRPHQKIELMQVWINSPARDKFAVPSVEHLLGKDMATIQCTETCTVKVICGSFTDNEGSAVQGPLNGMADSPIAVCHLHLGAGEKICISAPLSANFISYVRKGSLVNHNGELVHMGDMLVFDQRPGLTNEEEEYEEEVGMGVTEIQAGPKGLDALLLLGSPINESVVMGGPLVQENEADYRLAASYFNQIGPQAFWDPKLTNADWLAHVKKLDLQGLIRTTLEAVDKR